MQCIKLQYNGEVISFCPSVPPSPHCLLGCFNPEYVCSSEMLIHFWQATRRYMHFVMRCLHKMLRRRYNCRFRVLTPHPTDHNVPLLGRHRSKTHHHGTSFCFYKVFRFLIMRWIWLYPVPCICNDYDGTKYDQYIADCDIKKCNVT
jgi:hypothetical protein